MQRENYKKFLFKSYGNRSEYEIYDFSLSELDLMIESLKQEKEKCYIGWDNYSGRRVEFKEFFESNKFREDISVNQK